MVVRSLTLAPGMSAWYLDLLPDTQVFRIRPGFNSRIASTVVPYLLAILYRVSPAWIT